MRTALLVLALAVCGCGGDDDAPPLDAAGDAGDGPAGPAWDRAPPPSSVMSSRRGLTPLRGIVHLHGPFSWDACDGDPRPGGVVDEACVEDLRRGLCDTNMDFAVLTD